jgi:glycosyltransferase involved in cell wall biosynthesis
MRAFPAAKRQPSVLYPCVTLAPSPKPDGEVLAQLRGRTVFLSINRCVSGHVRYRRRLLRVVIYRCFLLLFPSHPFVSARRYERKKNISLAIKAFALLPEGVLASSLLVVAGGYDTKVGDKSVLRDDCACCWGVGASCSSRRECFSVWSAGAANASLCLQVRENVEYMIELQEEAQRLLGQNSKSVMFMKSVSEGVKAALLQSARALLYVSACRTATNICVETVFLKCCPQIHSHQRAFRHRAH